VKAEAEAEYRGLIADAVNRLMAVPSQIAPDVVGSGELWEVEEVLETAIREALDEVAGADVGD